MTSCSEGESSSTAVPEASAPSPSSACTPTFASLGVCEELCRACENLKWILPTEIQMKAIPPALESRDVIGLSATGSGKTAAFAIPIIQALLEDPVRMRAVALAPTRELCVQISEQFLALGAGIWLEVAVLVGGLDLVAQAMVLSKKPHVVVASPGRLVDHLENTKGFHLKNVKFLVLDEADRMLSMDFEMALTKIVMAIPKTRNTYMFSATMTSKVSKLQRLSLVRPVRIEVSEKYNTVQGLVQHFLLIPYKYKFEYLAAVMDRFRHVKLMCFTATCLGAHRTALFLRKLAHQSTCLHGKMTQTQRLGALNQFKSGSRSVLVVTEVGSRGLDIPAVELVLNFDVPLNCKDYIHRVGRTARAGRSGRALTFVTQYDVEAFQKLETTLDKKMDEFVEVSEERALERSVNVQETLRLAELEIKEAGSGLFFSHKRGNKTPFASFSKKRRS